ncbi:hypothetical protein [Sphingomonas hankookensis]|uniref:Uncharacterized protein n=1 Tax=Sphingomonas hankookensis TaxID=563996 RepID=A0ABR5YCK8_9SPHN|nr:hypothetical protein [Sphingomonas hankookensis]KZE13266.1 hypothetical protein AVT10_03585 [Sphingomonas hankookensis]
MGKRQSGWERHVIDLTGPQSHVLVMEPGVGSLSIGPASPGRRVDLVVAADDRIDWHVFDPFRTLSDYPWPRFITYAGSDGGLFDRACTRRIEDATWVPLLTGDRTIDARDSRLHKLRLRLTEPGGRLHLILPDRSASPHFELRVEGDLSRLSCEGVPPKYLTLAPATRRRAADPPLELPALGALEQVERLTLWNDPLVQPVSLRGLARFPNLRSLTLRGEIADLDRLVDHPRLTGLELRDMPDLSGLPPLTTWPDLDGFVATDIDDGVGKRLRRELNARARQRPFAHHTRIAQLRKPEWWAREYGRPFAAWPPRRAKIANAAFDTAQAAIAAATSLAEVQAAITAFAAHFNTVKGIETTEREALADAVWQLGRADAATALGTTDALALQWFDAARDY